MMKTLWSSLHQRQDTKEDGNGNRGPEAGTGVQVSHLRSGGTVTILPLILPCVKLLTVCNFFILSQQFENGISLQFHPDYVLSWSQKIVAR